MTTAAKFMFTRAITVNLVAEKHIQEKLVNKPYISEMNYKAVDCYRPLTGMWLRYTKTHITLMLTIKIKIQASSVIGI